MLESRARTQRFGSIDSATALGELADHAIMALDELQGDGQLSVDGRAALERLVGVLDRTSIAVADPLARLRTSPAGTFASLEAVAPALTGAARKVSGTAPAAGDAEPIRQLQMRVSAVIDGTATRESVDELVTVFEAIATSMLATVDSLIASPQQTAWTRTFAS